MFDCGPALVRCDGLGCDEPGSPAKPASDDDLWTDGAGFPGEDDEDGLNDFFGKVRVARLTPGDGIHQVHMTPNELFKRPLQAKLGVLAQQIDVAVIHSNM